MRIDFLAIFYIILAILLWGIGPIFDKLTLKYLNPTSAFLGRTFVMVILFIPLLLFRFSSTYSDLISSSKNVWLYLFMSVTTAMAGVYFYLKAMNFNEASKIVPLSSTYPLITMILSFFFLGEGITLNKIIGTILISIGIYFITK